MRVRWFAILTLILWSALASAQSLQWDSDGVDVTAFQVTLDSQAPVSLPATARSWPLPTIPVGAHTLTVSACNLALCAASVPLSYTVSPQIPAPVPTPTPVPSTSFPLGTRVQMDIAGVLVRPDPTITSAFIGAQDATTLGSISQACVADVAPGSNRTYCKVDFDGGVDGWVTAEHIVVVTTPAPIPVPAPVPVPVPVSVCVSAPLKISNIKWPSAASGSARLDFTANFPKASVSLSFGLHPALSVTDTRGCTATVTK